MDKVISIIGGDLRIVKLIDILIQDGYKVYTYGLEKMEKKENVFFCDSLTDAIKEAVIVLGPMPLTSDRTNVSTPFSDKKIDLNELLENLNGKRFIAGNIIEPVRRKLEEKSIQYTDLLSREELVVLNTIATAEGAIQIAMQETLKTLHGSNVLVMGFGRVGKILAKTLAGIGANVYCEARKNEDIAWITAYGYNPVHIKNLNKVIGNFDIIMNTIPSIVLDSTRINLLKKDCLIIDLASYPGGVDIKAAKDKNIKSIWALSLPGKVAPVTSAEFIKETLDNIILELAN